MNITSTILNNYVARRRTTTLSYTYSSSGGGGGQCSSPSPSAGKEATKSWVQRAFYSTPAINAPKANPSDPTKPRHKRRKSKPAVHAHQWAPAVQDCCMKEPTVRFSKPSVDEGAEVFKFCLVGKFPGRRPSLEQIRDWAGKEWKLRGEWSITLLDRSHVFIRLDNKDDMVRVWPRSRWFVCGNLMKVFKWVPTFFTATAREPSSAAVWISLPSLPVVLFQEKFLYQVAGLVGKAVAMDEATRNLSRTNVARVCVEVDLARKLPERVRIEIGDVGFWQDVVCEKLPYYCTHCNKQGHSIDICKFSKKVEQEKVDSMSTTSNQSFPNAMLDLQAQTSPAILNRSGRKKRVTITDGVYPTTDSKEKKKRGESVDGCVEEVSSREHKKTNIDLAIGSFRKTVGDVVIGTSTMEIEQSPGTDQSSVELDINMSRKRRVIEREENEGVDRPQPHGELQAWKKKEHLNITGSKTKSPIARQRFPLFFWKRNNKGVTDLSSSRSIHTSFLFASRCRHFTVAEIKRATNNFDRSRKIGEGGFGRVYRGRIDGIEVAIKKHTSFSNQGRREFETELNFLSKLRHKNLVNLIGYCCDKLNMILVYEFISRGNFKELLYGRSECLLSWKQKIEICLGAARGLCYMHENGVIHRDVKSFNILISEDYEAKISDLGLGRQIQDSRYDQITMLAGTIGYIDPEYCHTGKVTRKSDVYAFGVLLFEVLCGRPPTNRDLSERQKTLVMWALDLIENGKVEDIIDPRLRVGSDCLKKYVGLATSCVSLEGCKRPTMEEVVQELEFALKLVELDDCGDNTMDDCGLTFDEDNARAQIHSHGSHSETMPFGENFSMSPSN